MKAPDEFDRQILTTYIEHVFDTLGNGPLSFEQILKQYRDFKPLRQDEPTSIYGVLQAMDGIEKRRDGYWRTRP